MINKFGLIAKAQCEGSMTRFIYRLNVHDQCPSSMSLLNVSLGIAQAQSPRSVFRLNVPDLVMMHPEPNKPVNLLAYWLAYLHAYLLTYFPIYRVFLGNC